MKKILLLAAYMLPGILLAQSGSDYYEVVRGSRSGGNCIGNKSGICEIKTAQMQTSTKIYKYSENQILLSIEARAFDEYEQIVWLGRPLERVTNLDEFFFIQEEALEINAEVRKSLRFDSKSMFIAAGKYRAKLSEDNKRIEILLNLSEKR